MHEILAVLNCAPPILRARNIEGARDLLDRARDLLCARPLDAADRMILTQVLGRIRLAANGGADAEVITRLNDLDLKLRSA